MYEPYVTLPEKYRDTIEEQARAAGYRTNAAYLRRLIIESVDEAERTRER
jgi:hypothetical protein